MLTQPANFCSNCGNAITRRVPIGDNRERDCCDRCGAVHYVNPRLVVGTIPEWQGEILLCKRAIEPRYGLWTLPAGFMEIGETTLAGALRETLEEAGARVAAGLLFSVIDVPYVDQVHIFFRAQLLDLDFAPGDESIEARLFRESDIPWPQIAFRTVALTLQLYFADRRRGQFDTHTRALAATPTPSAPLDVQPSSTQ